MLDQPDVFGPFTVGRKLLFLEGSRCRVELKGVRMLSGVETEGLEPKGEKLSADWRCGETDVFVLLVVAADPTGKDSVVSVALLVE